MHIHTTPPFADFAKNLLPKTTIVFNFAKKRLLCENIFVILNRVNI